MTIAELALLITALGAIAATANNWRQLRHTARIDDLKFLRDELDAERAEREAEREAGRIEREKDRKRITGLEAELATVRQENIEIRAQNRELKAENAEEKALIISGEFKRKALEDKIKQWQDWGRRIGQAMNGLQLDYGKLYMLVKEAQEGKRTITAPLPPLPIFDRFDYPGTESSE